ncbi:MAG: Do family serine endopeptidase [Pseudomonadales bacterium]|jgi:serine protease Do|nr:Do family serine endopeptidase [Pseudomonadales bacterium]
MSKQLRAGFKLVVVSLILSFCHGSLGQSLPDFTVLVEDNAPAIVNVSTTRKVTEEAQQERETLEQLLRYLYRDRAPEFELPEPEEREAAATGSGFIIDPGGYLITNHHVIADADEITITLNDQREFKATVVGSDVPSDLALLKIDASDLPTVTLGDSSQLKVGEWVLAIGSPFGLQYSVAAGIVSYMGRSLPSEDGQYVSFIQTDVAINPGHSGGPLFNLRGEVIGINSQIFTSNGGSIGLSFAIPVDVAKNVIGQLRDSGTVRRGWLGVGYEDVSQSLSEAFGLDTPRGALVNRIIKDSPAQAAGIQLGDVITAFDNHPIRKSADLPYYVGLVLPNSTVPVDLIRNGQPTRIDLTIGLRDEEVIAAVPEAPELNRLGLVVVPADKELLSNLGVAVTKAIVVQEVSGVAEAAKLRMGDVILTLNGEEVGTQAELDALAKDLPANRSLPVLVSRGGGQTFFTIRIDE